MEKLYQLRIKTDQTLSEDLRGASESETARQVLSALDRFDARLACVFDEFCGYCAEAEKNGIENYPLYHWTKSVIDDPKKQQKHQRSFTIYMGAAAVYPIASAQDLMAALEAVASGKNIHVQLVDTDPSKNPQPPGEFTNTGSGQGSGA
ncbi:MAG: hypothetical protein VXW20_03870 [Pseudomonadota bacterium]|nr:hypothetical protein [Pseudomonadota bacterium]